LFFISSFGRRNQKSQKARKIDSLIFIGLLLILLWNNVTHHGPQLTTSLLMVLRKSQKARKLSTISSEVVSCGP
jgi:hypothetical protein